jgi:hypothetical protein
MKIKNWDGLKVHNPQETLLNETLVASAILECLKDNDTEALIEIIEGYIEALDTFARE